MEKKFGWAIETFFFAKALLNRYHYSEIYSKDFEIYFLGTIFWLPRAKFCCKVVLLHLCRYYTASYTSCDPTTWS